MDELVGLLAGVNIVVIVGATWFLATRFATFSAHIKTLLPVVDKVQVLEVKQGEITRDVKTLFRDVGELRALQQAGGAD